MMYASCPRYFDEVGRGNLTAGAEKEILENLPPFNPETARSARDNGALVAHASWPDRFFATIVDGYLANTGNRGGRVGKAKSYLFSARGLLDIALKAMKSVAAGGP